MVNPFKKNAYLSDSLNYAGSNISIKNIITNKNIEKIEELNHRIF